MDKRHWGGLSYLEALRPEPGWIVNRAILATYSADLVAIVAALLALAGLDDDRDSGSRVDFATAYEQLRDKVKVLVQAGRIASPPKKLSILSILDRFIVEVNADEKVGCWHPKLALIRMIEETTADVEWRLWISSRNLTRSLDWDAGLILVGHTSGEGRDVPGVAEIGAELAQIANLKDFDSAQIYKDLQQILWQSPAGTAVQEVRLLTPNSKRSYPAWPTSIKRLAVISPFADGTTIDYFGNWGDNTTERWLLSTQAELARLSKQAKHPLAKFHRILCLDIPQPDGDETPSEATEETPEISEDEEIESRGVHAKLIYTQYEDGNGTLWLGSPNATIRGWKGPNIEVVARLTVDQTVAEGLEAFLEMARPVDLQLLSGVEEQDSEELLLEEARKEVAARWQVTQRRHSNGPQLISSELPHPSCVDIKMEIGLLGCDLIEWPRKQKIVQLPSASPAQETELIRIKLSLDNSQCTWLQQALLDPRPDEERDRRALARHLNPRIFMDWIRSLLYAEDIGDGGGDWDKPLRPRHHASSNGPDWWAPTLEEVLRAWTRNPNSLLAVDRKVEDYLKLMQEQQDSERTEDEQKILEEFHQTWSVLRQEFVLE